MSRDPKRISKYCQILEECWSKQSDWRFAQLIENYNRFYLLSDPFYVEDDKYFAGLKAYIEEATN